MSRINSSAACARATALQCAREEEEWEEDDDAAEKEEDE
jgi:hypothetical protein